MAELKAKTGSSGFTRIFNKGFRSVKHVFKNGWYKVKNIRKKRGVGRRTTVTI